MEMESISSDSSEEEYMIEKGRKKQSKKQSKKAPKKVESARYNIAILFDRGNLSIHTAYKLIDEKRFMNFEMPNAIRQGQFVELIDNFYNSLNLTQVEYWDQAYGNVLVLEPRQEELHYRMYALHSTLRGYRFQMLQRQAPLEIEPLNQRDEFSFQQEPRDPPTQIKVPRKSTRIKMKEESKPAQANLTALQKAVIQQAGYKEDIQTEQEQAELMMRSIQSRTVEANLNITFNFVFANNYRANTRAMWIFDTYQPQQDRISSRSRFLSVNQNSFQTLIMLILPNMSEEILTGQLIEIQMLIKNIASAMRVNVGKDQEKVIQNVVKPFYLEFSKIFISLVHDKFIAVDGNDPCPIFTQYFQERDMNNFHLLSPMFRPVKGRDGRYTFQRVPNLNVVADYSKDRLILDDNFFDRFTTIFKSIYSNNQAALEMLLNMEAELQKGRKPFGMHITQNREDLQNIAAELAIDIFASFLGICNRDYRSIRHFLTTPTENINLEARRKELLELVYDSVDYFLIYMKLYYNNARNIEYSYIADFHAIYTSALLCQMYNPRYKPVPYDPELIAPSAEEYKMSLNFVDTIRYVFTYFLTQLYIHSIKWTPQELKIIQLLFYPHEMKFVLENQPVQHNYLPALNTPFTIPHMILCYGLSASTEQLVHSMDRPGLLLAHGIINHRERTTGISQDFDFSSYTITPHANMIQTVFTLSTPESTTDTHSFIDPRTYVYPEFNDGKQLQVSMGGVYLDEGIENPRMVSTGLRQVANMIMVIFLQYRQQITDALVDGYSIKNDHTELFDQIYLRYSESRLGGKPRINRDDLSKYLLETGGAIVTFTCRFILKASNEPGRLEYATSRGIQHPSTGNYDPTTSRHKLAQVLVPIRISSDDFLQDFDTYTRMTMENIRDEELIQFWIVKLLYAIDETVTDGFMGSGEMADSSNINTMSQLLHHNQEHDYVIQRVSLSITQMNTNTLKKALDQELNGVDYFEEYLRVQNRIAYQLMARSATINPTTQNMAQFYQPSRFISNNVFNYESLSFHYRDMIIHSVTPCGSIYWVVLELGYSCLAAITSVLFRLLTLQPILGDESTCLQNTTRYGYRYFINEVLSKIQNPKDRSRMEETDEQLERLVWVVIGDGDIIGYFICKTLGLPNDLCKQVPKIFDVFCLRATTRPDEELLNDITIPLSEYPDHSRFKTYNLQSIGHLRIIPICLQQNHLFLIPPRRYYQEYIPRSLHEFNTNMIRTQQIPQSFPYKTCVQFKKPKPGQQKLIFYDLETTVGKCIPYMIAWYSCDYLTNLAVNQEGIFNTEWVKNNIQYAFIDEYNKKSGIANLFVAWLKMYIEAQPSGTEIQLHAFNGSKFDHIFLFPELSAIFRDYRMTGTPSNIKSVMFRFARDVQLILVDSRLAVGGGSLNSFAASMGVQSKQDCDDIKLISSVDEWLNHPNQARILEYCQYDVAITAESVLRFNRKMHKLAVDLFQKFKKPTTTPTKDFGRLYIENTLAGTAFDMVNRYIRDGEMQPLNDIMCYIAARSSMRGGITQTFSQDKFTRDNQTHIFYKDENSMYPAQLAFKKFICYLDTYQSMEYTMRNPPEEFVLYGIRAFQLPSEFKYGFIPVKTMESGRIFYPLSWDLDDEHEMLTKKSRSAMIEPHQLIWVWGFQLQMIWNLIGLISKQNEHEKNQMFSKLSIRVNAQVFCKNPSKWTSSIFRNIESLFEMRAASKCPTEKLLLKLVMNSSYGQLAMKEYPMEHFIPTDAFKAAYQNGGDDIEILMDRIAREWHHGEEMTVSDVEEYRDINVTRLRLDYVNKRTDLPQSDKTRFVHIGSQVTARARTELLGYMYKFLYCTPSKRDRGVIYTDTDSVIGYCDPLDIEEVDKIFNMGNGLGQFKDEYDNIQNFQAIAPKMYRLQCANGKIIHKLKGFDQRQATTIQMDNLFESVLFSSSGVYTQIQWKRDKHSATIIQNPITKRIRLFNKRQYSPIFNNDIETYMRDLDRIYRNTKQVLEAEASYRKRIKDEITQAVNEIAILDTLTDSQYKKYQDRLINKQRSEIEEEIDTTHLEQEQKIQLEYQNQFKQFISQFKPTNEEDIRECRTHIASFDRTLGEWVLIWFDIIEKKEYPHITSQHPNRDPTAFRSLVELIIGCHLLRTEQYKQYQFIKKPWEILTEIIGYRSSFIDKEDFNFWLGEAHQYELE